MAKKESPQSRILLKPLLCVLSSGLHYSHWKAPPGAPVCALKEPRARFTRRHSKANTKKHVSSCWARLSHTTSVSSRKRGASLCTVSVYLQQYTSTTAEWMGREGCIHIPLANSSVWIWSGGSGTGCAGITLFAPGAFTYFAWQIKEAWQAHNGCGCVASMCPPRSNICLRPRSVHLHRSVRFGVAVVGLEYLITGSAPSQSLSATFANVTLPWLQDDLDVSGDLKVWFNFLRQYL